MTKDELILRYQNVLQEWTRWEPNKGIIEPIKPGHGPCCTCQICGRDYDYCVCEHNEIEHMINNG